MEVNSFATWIFAFAVSSIFAWKMRSWRKRNPPAEPDSWGNQLFTPGGNHQSITGSQQGRIFKFPTIIVTRCTAELLSGGWIQWPKWLDNASPFEWGYQTRQITSTEKRIFLRDQIWPNEFSSSSYVVQFLLCSRFASHLDWAQLEVYWHLLFYKTGPGGLWTFIETPFFRIFLLNVCFWSLLVVSVFRSNLFWGKWEHFSWANIEVFEKRLDNNPWGFAFAVTIKWSK